jgi:5-methylcytosine-specific restriction endonuclease McrA
MTFPSRDRIPLVRQKRIAIAAGCRCELCGEEYFAADLEIHTIGTARGRTGESLAYLERDLLVLCPRCHRDVHEQETGEEEQRALLAYRPPEVTEAIRAILSTRPKPYAPPEVDLEETFADVTHLRTHYRGM